MSEREPPEPFAPQRGEITLGALVKVVLGVSGGTAKRLVQEGTVRVDGQIETRRGRRLGPGALVEIEGRARPIRVTEPQQRHEPGAGPALSAPS